MKNKLIIICLLVSVFCFAQDDKKGTIKVKKVKSSKIDTIYDEPIILPYPDSIVVLFPDQAPFLTNMVQFIQKNLKYPPEEKKKGTQATVYVAFIVEADGGLSNIQIRGTRGLASFEKEAIRVVSIMPKWTAGVKNGQAVRVQCTLPIKFES